MSNEDNESLEPLISEDGSDHVRYAEKLVVIHGTVEDILGKPFKIFSKYVKVFDLYFVATEASPDYKVLHGATVLYQYIDNTNSGTPDNELIYAKLKQKKATMVMFKDQDELEEHGEFYDEVSKRDDIMIQDLEADETRPGSILPRAFDEALEECFHLVTQGYILAYPDIFGLKHGSAVSLMMDCARGGYFEKIPKKYPSIAWYTYYDETCDYPCMITEYLYWAITTILGAQQYRHSETKDEWKPYTRELIERIDNPIYSLLTDPTYKLPTKLPVPVAGMPLYLGKGVTYTKSNDNKTACCGCFGKYPSKLKETFLKKYKR